jgi:hypothetical protein
LQNVFRECSKRRKIEAYLQDLAPGDIERLLNDWELWAREDQLPPNGPWITWLVLGGRGAGKTRAGAEWVRAVALEHEAARIALIGETLSDVRSVMVEGISGLLGVHANHERPKFEPSKKQITWKNGAIAQIFSAEDPESLRGPQFSHAWNGVLAVRKGRAAVPNALGFASVQERSSPQEDALSQALHPVWVIVVYEVKEKKLIGITEFVFASYQDCQSGAEEARQELGLQLMPVCYVRWMKVEPGRGW